MVFADIGDLGELADSVLRLTEANPSAVRLLGGSKQKIRKYWLDIDYPSYPPPLYEIPG
jgi:hypothetical protein